jgi:hypothetical protein
MFYSSHLFLEKLSSPGEYTCKLKIIGMELKIYNLSYKY